MTETRLRPYDEALLMLAIEESQKAVDAGCMPFGAVIADAEGNVIVAGHNLSAAKSARGGSGDTTRHAEMEVIRMLSTASTLSSTEVAMNDCTLYASTEPCVMCAGATYWSEISRVVFGASSEELHKLSGPGGFDIPLEKLYDMGREGTRPMTVIGPMLLKNAMQVHLDSGIWKSPGTESDEKAVKQADIDIEAERALFSSGIGAAAAAKDDYVVPVIDMSIGTDDEIAQKLWAAATTVGFFTLVGHGVEMQAIEEAFEVSAEFFSEEQSIKEKESPYARNFNAGYEYMAQVRPSTGTADQKESIQLTFREEAMDGRWPSKPDNFRTAAENLSFQSHKLACRLLDLLEPRACPNLTPGTLSSSHKLWASDCQCTLRMLHYPPMDAETALGLSTPDENGRIFWRAGPHTDWTCVSLLFQQVGQAGLECCSNPRDASKEGARWTPIDPVKGGIAVNIGDMFARWSNGRLYSNLHRVRMPTEEECTPPSSRYSIAFFAQADKSALIETDGQNPLTAGDYILSRVQSNFAK